MSTFIISNQMNDLASQQAGGADFSATLLAISNQSADAGDGDFSNYIDGFEPNQDVNAEAAVSSEQQMADFMAMNGGNTFQVNQDANSI